MLDMPMIIGGYNTDDCKRRLEQCARNNGYHVAEWLIPSAHQPEDGTMALRVVATTKYCGKDVDYGFRWSGDDINVLASLCMALDLTMSQIQMMGKRGELPHQEAKKARRALN